MGWWAPTIFGGDPPLDALEGLKRAVAVEIAPGDDRGYGAPDGWNERVRAAWAEKVEAVEAWCVETVERDRADARRGARIWLGLIEAANGAFPGSPDEETLEALATSLGRAAASYASIANGNKRAIAFVADGCGQAARALREKRVPPMGALQVAIDIFAKAGTGGLTGWEVARTALARAGAAAALPASAWDEDFRTKLIAAAPELRPVILAAASHIDASLPAILSDGAIAVQVATSVIMGTGRPLSERMRALAAQSVLLDPWEGKSEARNAVLADFIAGLRSYRAAPWVQRHRGLREAFDRAAEEGGTDLINVGPGTTGPGAPRH